MLSLLQPLLPRCLSFSMNLSSSIFCATSYALLTSLHLSSTLSDHTSILLVFCASPQLSNSLYAKLQLIHLFRFDITYVAPCMVNCDLPRSFIILYCLQSATVLPDNIVSTYLASVTSLWPVLEINEVLNLFYGIFRTLWNIANVGPHANCKLTYHPPDLSCCFALLPTTTHHKHSQSRNLLHTSF